MPRMVSSVGQGSFQFPLSVTTASLPLFADQFSGTTILLSLSKEKANYVGPIIRCSNSSGASAVDIGSVGSALDPVAADAAIAANRAFCDIIYDQSGNGNNATQPTLSRRWKLIKISTGVYGLQMGTGQGMVIADNASHKTTVIDLYFVGQIGETYNDSTNYHTVIAAWAPSASAAAENTARWGFILSEGGFGDGLELPRNGAGATRTSQGSQPTTIPIGNGYRTNFHTWNYNSNRRSLRRNDVLLWDDVTMVDGSGNGGTAAANVTYSGTGAIYLGNNGTYVESAQGIFQALAIFGTTRADHAAINSYMMTRWGTAEPATTYSTSDGFTWTPVYVTDYIADNSADVNGIFWWHETGAYPATTSRGPSCAIANNVNNGVPYVRYEVRTNDNDTIDTGAERAERGGQLSGVVRINRGDTFDRFFQIYIESGLPQLGDWCLCGQAHYNNNNGNNEPDLCFISLQGNPSSKTDAFQVVTQGTGSDVLRGSAQAYTRGTWYAFRILGTWGLSAGGDSLQVWFGPNGTTLTQIVNVSGTLFNHADDGAFIKQGVYRGFPGNNADFLAVRFANEKFAKSSSFASLITTQPALPTHA